MEKTLIDTSYSGIVNAIEGDPGEAEKLALKLIDQVVEAERKIKKLEAELNSVKFIRASSLNGLQHIKKLSGISEKNYIVITPDKLYEIEPDGVKTKTNFLKKVTP